MAATTTRRRSAAKAKPKARPKSKPALRTQHDVYIVLEAKNKADSGTKFDELRFRMSKGSTTINLKRASWQSGYYGEKGQYNECDDTEYNIPLTQLEELVAALREGVS